MKKDRLYQVCFVVKLTGSTNFNNIFFEDFFKKVSSDIANVEDFMVWISECETKLSEKCIGKSYEYDISVVSINML